MSSVIWDFLWTIIKAIVILWVIYFLLVICVALIIMLIWFTLFAIFSSMLSGSRSSAPPAKKSRR